MTNLAVQHTDAQLVVAYQQTKAPEALSGLYRKYHERIFRYCLGIVREREPALDITQDVFLKAAEQLHRLQKPVTFPAWLFRIAHNRCMDHCKADGRILPMPGAAGEALPDDAADPEELWAREQRFDAIEGLLCELGEDARTLLRLKYLEHYSIQELQDRFQLSESAVKMRLSRARRRIEALYRRRYA